MDVTNSSELMSAMRLLEQKNETLEHRVEDRTAELAEATRFAEKARASAEQANHERGALWTR